ncbi:MAG: ABC transporter substrate-binding protein [Bacteroidales bacterium]|jgi:ABC-type Fe3+-hydroxamate transport system substrate-binding protein|nr:ABC transporter substrate-binding protein [Bacteroidales bacterium]
MTRNKKNIILTLLIFLSINSYAKEVNRIISLAPSITNMIYLLEAQNKLVGCTNYCLEGVKDGKNIVANAIDVNVEKVFLLKPDIVFTAGLTKPSTIEALKKLNINVLTFPSAKTYTEICEQFITIACYTGREQLAKKIVEYQKRRLDSIKKSIPKGEKPKIFIELGAKPLFTAVPNTFMDDFIAQAGGINIATDISTGIITRENVILKDPDAIVIVTMGIVGEEEKAVWKRYKQLSAARKGKIFTVDPYKSCGPNPVTFVDVVEELVTKLYK